MLSLELGAEVTKVAEVWGVEAKQVLKAAADMSCESKDNSTCPQIPSANVCPAHARPKSVICQSILSERFSARHGLLGGR